MPYITVGFRRLYDALGVHISSTDNAEAKTLLANGKTINVYLGKTPTMGIVTVEGAQFYIPGRESKLIHTSADYEAPCFIEIIVSTEHEVSDDEQALLEDGDEATRQKYFQLVQQDAKFIEQLDATSGVLGLLLHKQLVLKPLAEHMFMSGNFEPVSSFVGPYMEVLEELTLQPSTSAVVQGFTDGFIETAPEVLLKGSSILFWLLRAWRERDHIAKFMYLFIPLEAILPSSKEIASNSKSELEALEAIVKDSKDTRRESLLAFLERAKTKFNPSLISRFEAYARSAAIPGWEADVAAFKKFNNMRNLLLHSGKRQVNGHINVDANTRTLEDLVERYVAHHLLAHSDVYESKWRPKRLVSPATAS